MPGRHAASRTSGASPSLSVTAAPVAGGVLLACGAAAVALHSIPSLQLLNRYTVMAAAFIPYGLLAFGGAAAIFATSRSRWVKPFAVVAVAGVLLQAWWAKPYWPAPAPASSGSPFALLTMNMRCDSRGISELGVLADRFRPDVAIVQGLYAELQDALGEPWTRLLPHSTFHPMPHLPECGTFVFSRTPLRELSAVGASQPVLEVARADGPIALLPVDLPTPSKGVQPWSDAFRHLTQTVNAHADRPLVVAGDFNAVREHVPLRRLLDDTGLRDAAEVAGAGWRPTFPTRSWHPPLIGLDHALISPTWEATDVHTATIQGQDHRAVVLRLARS